MTPDDAVDPGDPEASGVDGDRSEDGAENGRSGDGDDSHSGDGVDDGRPGNGVGDSRPEDGDDDVEDDPTTVSPDIDDPFPSVTVGSETQAETDEGELGEFDAGKPPETGLPPDAADPAPESEGDDGLGWHGWVLVGGLIVAMVLVPWAVVFLPQMQGFLGSLGLGVRDAYLVLPMVPALGLGILAVWAAIAYRRRE